MIHHKLLSKPTLNFAIFLFIALLLLFFTGYWQQHASAATVMSANGTIPPGTIPPAATPPADKARITVIHAAPFAADIANTALDICTQEGTVVSGLAGLKYLDNASIFVNPGSYDLKIADAGSNCTALRLDLAAFTLITQEEVVLVITGDGSNQPLDALLYVANPGAHTLYLPIIAKGA